MEVGKKMIGGRDTNMTSYACRNICERYPYVPSTGYAQGRRSHRLNPYFDLKYKYCSVCGKSFQETTWTRFRNPIHCNCCGCRLRVRPAKGVLKAVEYFRYD